MWAWGQLTTFFSNLWTGIKNTAADIWNRIGDAIIRIVAKVKKAWQDFKDWFRNLFRSINSSMEDKIAEMQQKAQAVTQANNRSASFSNAAEKVFVFSKAAPGTNAANSNTPGFALPQPANVNNNKSTYAIQVTNNITGGNPADMQTAMQNNNRDLMKQLQEQQRKQDRTKFN
jgi:hypothetical protein